MSSTSRAALVSQLRDQFEWDGFPRLTVTFILALAGLAALLVSVVALRLGVDHMGVRYAVAGAGGYGVFLLLIRAWIAAHRGWSPDLDPATGADLASSVVEDVSAETGAAWGGRAGRPESPIASTSNADDWFAFDDDSTFLVVLAVLFVLGGGLALAYVIYSAPLLLAEVALDAALVASVSRRLRREDAGSWTGAALRHTLGPAAALILFVAAGGALLQQLAPEAHTLGAVIRAIGAR